MEAVKPKTTKQRIAKIKSHNISSRSISEAETAKGKSELSQNSESVIKTSTNDILESNEPVTLGTEASSSSECAKCDLTENLNEGGTVLIETTGKYEHEPKSEELNVTNESKDNESVGKVLEHASSENKHVNVECCLENATSDIVEQVKSDTLEKENVIIESNSVKQKLELKDKNLKIESGNTVDSSSSQTPVCDIVEENALSHVQVLEESVSSEVPAASCPEASEIPELGGLIEPLYPMQELADALVTQQEESKDELTRVFEKTVAKTSEREALELIRPFTEEQLLALYRNEELQTNDAFIDYFIQHEKDPQNSEFHELLQGYLRSRLKLVTCRKERDEIHKDAQSFANNIWILQSQTVSGMSPCADGVNVTRSHTYKYATMNQDTLTSLSQLLQQMREQVQESLSLHAYEAVVAKLQIETYIHTMLSGSSLIQVPCNAAVVVVQPHELTGQQAAENQRLRECIGDLFSFQRRPVSDQKFIDDTRKWLTDLVALLLRRSTIADHLFVLNHVLRCPAGISNWATCYIQPLPPVPWITDPSTKYYLSSSLLDHSLTVLATLLLPIKARDAFLQPFGMMLRSANPDSYGKKTEDRLWVLVDSEGEEDEDLGTMWLQWQEADVISLINQVPLADLFRHALFIHSKEDMDDYDVKRTEEHGMLRLLALGSRLLQLLGQGFQTYNSLRFKQLTKRISRLIRHTVQYISDHWEAFCSCSTADPALLKRMQVEFDNFFLRAINCIFSSQRMGSWQFMAVLPYKNVSLPMMWCVLWTLHHIHHLEDSQKIYHDTNYEAKLKDPMVRLLFEEKLSQLPESEAFYLLTAFANMAKARSHSDKNFIAAVCLEVMEIAFINMRLRESLSKEGRDLLSAIAAKHPFVMSLLLKSVVEKIDKMGMMSLYLFRSLPISLWVPDKQDLDILGSLLLTSPLPSAGNQLAKLVVTSMNWEDNSQKDKLFLSAEIHCQIAMLVVQACETHARQDSDSGIFMWSLQQALLVAQSLRQSATQATTPQGFLTWAWDTLLSLRLHVLDRPCVPWTSVLAGDACSNDPSIPDMDADPRLHLLQMGIRSGQPPALYVAILMTTTGHRLKSLSVKGLGLWSALVAKEMYPAATHILSFILPFFYPNPSILLTNERFLNDLLLVVLADLTFKSVAKSLIYTVFPGKALQHFAGMLRYQIRQGRAYAAEVGGQAVRFWCQVLFHLLSSSQQKSHLAKWKGTDHVHYLLDQLFKIALQDTYLLDTLMETMSRMVKDQSPTTSSGGMASSLFSLVSWSSGSGNSWPSLLSFPTIPNFPCLFWGVLTAETNHPQMIQLWESLLNELASNGCMTPEVALKNVCGSLHLPVPLLTSLPIYRWAQELLEVDLQHPCLPLLWQNFFMLYLYRTSTSKGSMGFRFFADNPHLGMLKKMKRRLGEISELYKKIASECSEELENLRKNMSEDEHADIVKLSEGIREAEALHLKKMKLVRFYRSLTLWIEEPRLHESLNLQSLPQQYDAERIHSVIHTRQKIWLDLVDLDMLQNDLNILDNIWLQQRKALPSIPPLFDVKEELSASDRIINRLKTYEDPLPAPRVPRLHSYVTQVTPELMSNEFYLQESVKESSKQLISKASTFCTHISKHLALDSEYVELLPNLYRNVEAQTLVRETCTTSSGCEGPATFYLKYKEARMLNGVKADIDQNRLSYDELLEHFGQAPDLKTCASAVFVRNCITALVKQNCNKNLGPSCLKRAKEAGVSLFYYFLSLVDGATNQYPPTRQFISSCLDVLGQEFVHGHEDQCLPLVQQVLSRPNLAGLVAPLFTTAQVSSASLLHLYQVLVSKLCPNLSSALFVLLTKFDLGGWFRSSKPSVPERTKLLESIFSALKIIGREPADDMLVVLDVFRNHLQLLNQHQFPEIFGHTLQALLKGAAEGWVSVCVWEDFISSLAGGCHRPQSRSKEVVGQWLIAFASSQPHLHLSEAENSLAILSKFLLQHRQSTQKQRKGGLYQSLSAYFDPLVQLLSMLAHAYISLAHPEGAVLWEVVCQAFCSWLEPLPGDPTSQPFGPEDVEPASWVLDLFVLTIVHLHNACSRTPHQNNRTVLSCVWEWYEKLCSQTTSTKHLTSTIHEALKSLPWQEFNPTSDDLNSMKRVFENGKPECHDFLGFVFLNVHWPSVSEALQKQNKGVAATALNTVAALFVQLAWNPYVIQSGHLPGVVSLLESINIWPLLSPVEVQQLVLSACNLSDANKLVQKTFPEVLVFRFLQSLAGLGNCSWFDVNKRSAFISGVASLAAKATPLCVQNHKSDFAELLSSLVEHCLTPSGNDPHPSFEDLCTLLPKYVWLLKPHSCSTESREFSFRTVMARLQLGGPLVLPLVAVVCKTQLANPAHLVQIIELALEVACNTSLVFEDGYSGWRHLVPLLAIEKSQWEDFFKASQENSCHLTQNAFLLHVLPNCHATTQEMDFLHRAVDWCSKIKASEEAEPKLLLLWDKVLELSLRQFDLNGDVKSTERILHGFCASLQAMGEDKLSVGLLGAVGLGRRSPFSTQLRLMCRSVSAFILCQMPTNGAVRLTPNAPGHVRSQEGSKGKPSQQALQALAKVESTRNSKTYSMLLHQVDYAWNFILDARYSLRDTRSLIREFSAMFYSQKAFLKILSMDGTQ